MPARSKPGECTSLVAAGAGRLEGDPRLHRQGHSANAKPVVRDILAHAATLPETPRVGRRVPEFDDADIREVPAHSWRVIHHLRGNSVSIVTLAHRRRAACRVNHHSTGHDDR
ncbi:MAG: hypothetical protein FJ191_11435 [Gammaproteobacteria bacterium]|nr:hypothetical protein [Gammaproteobacteria bacterium]